MKKIILAAAVAILALTNVNAQEGSALSEGSWVIEANTGSTAVGNTSFSYSSVDGNSTWSLGAEAGYFLKENLALKVGLGITDNGGDKNPFAYKVGVKYYLKGMIPLGVDFTGATNSRWDPSNNELASANYLGLQGGYAWFVAPNVSVEPALRYNIAMSDNTEDEFQALVGFAFHF